MYDVQFVNGGTIVDRWDVPAVPYAAGDVFALDGPRGTKRWKVAQREWFGPTTVLLHVEPWRGL
jgi:hypothetical protein